MKKSPKVMTAIDLFNISNVILKCDAAATTTLIVLPILLGDPQMLPWYPFELMKTEAFARYLISQTQNYH